MLSKFLDIERFIHSLKTGIACVVGLLLSKIIGFPADQWVVITIIVVMCAQIYVGSVLQKAYLRFIGTCIGCLLAVGVIELIDNSLLTIAITIGATGFIFSYISTSRDKFSYAGTLGAVTTAIILLGQGKDPTVAFALERFLEISLGIFIATVVSQYVLPIHARTHLRRTQAATLRELRNLYEQAMTMPQTDKLILNYLDLDESIVKSLTKQRQLAKESAHEPKGSAFDPDNFMHSFYCEKEMLRAIDFMYDALTHIHIKQKAFFNSDEVKKFHDDVLHSLDAMIKVIESDQPESEHIHLPTLKHIKAHAEKSFYADGFMFAAEILTENLAKLAAHYHLKVYRDED